MLCWPFLTPSSSTLPSSPATTPVGQTSNNEVRGRNFRHFPTQLQNRHGQVWPLTQFITAVGFWKKRNHWVLGLQMTPHQAGYCPFLSCSNPLISVRTYERVFELQQSLKEPPTLPCMLLSASKIQGQCRVWQARCGGPSALLKQHTQTLIECMQIKLRFYTMILECKKVAQ